MSNKEELEQIWFVLGCSSPRHELKVRDDARRYGLRSFVPLTYSVKSVKGHDRRVLVPALTKYIYVKGTLEEVQEYVGNAHFQVFIQRSTFTGHKEFLTVPTKAMEDFIAVTENNEERVTYFNPGEIRLNVGDQIRVKGGLYDGREGIIMRVKGKRNRHLVVQIPGILIAAIEMTPDMIEMIDTSGTGTAVTSGKNVTAVPVPSVTFDKKALFELAHRLLFEFSDKYQNENEYYLLLSELKRTQARLVSFKGYTPASEAELALPLYMAAVKMSDVTLGTGTAVTSGENVTAVPVPSVTLAEARLRKAIEALKPSSLLRVKCQLYLAVLSKDPSLLEEVQGLFAVWRKAPLSSNQRALIEEFALLSNK